MMAADKIAPPAFKIGDRALLGDVSYSIIALDMLTVDGRPIVIAWLRAGTVYAMARTEELERIN